MVGEDRKGGEEKVCEGSKPARTRGLNGRRVTLVMCRLSDERRMTRGSHFLGEGTQWNPPGSRHRGHQGPCKCAEGGKEE